MVLKNDTNKNEERHLELVQPTPVSENRSRQEDDVIDLYELACIWLDHIHTIILCFLVGAVLLNAVAYFGIHPTYESTAKMYIVSASGDSVVDLTDLNIGTSLTQDYEELILSYPVLNKVVKNMHLDMTTDDLAEMIAISNPEDTRVLYITVTSTDPKESMDIANEVMEVAIDYLPKTMNTDSPNVAQKARMPEEKVGPSYAKYTLMGALLGALLCCGYFVFQYMMDDTLHTQEDVEKYFGIVPLTSIPESEVFAKMDDNDAAPITQKKKRKLIQRRLTRK